jgi:hypothetical protein
LKAFMKNQKSKLVNRVLLNKFIAEIAWQGFVLVL